MTDLLHSAAAYDRLELTAYTRKAIRGLSVAVVGCGALGSEVARLLGLLGMGSVRLIDPDVVEATNLIHSPYLRSADAFGRTALGQTSLGREKAVVLAENFTAHFPDTAWMAIPREIADTGFQHLQNCALLFSCTDSVLSRVEACYAAYRLGLPLMDAGLKGHAFWSGRVAWLPGGSAACYLCQLGEARRAELLSLSLAASQGCFTDLQEDQVLASTPTMASIVAGLQVDLGLRFVTTGLQAEAFACELSLPLPETGWKSFTIPRSSDCPWHEPDTSLDLLQLPMDMTLDKSLAELGRDQPAILELDWPLCVKARCTTCGHLWTPITPMIRLSVLRRRTACPTCGDSRLQSVETLSHITRGDRFASLTPRQLGLPDDHLFTLRRNSVPDHS